MLCSSTESLPSRFMSFETPLPPYNASDPHAVFINSSCFDFLLIEIVPLAERIAEDAASASQHNEAADEEAPKDSVFRRLESLGYRVGQGLVERYVLVRLTVDDRSFYAKA